MTRISIITYLILCSMPLAAMQHSVQPHRKLALPLPHDLKGKPIIHVKPTILQRDNFSCGYRAVFHAVALDKALQASQVQPTYLGLLGNTRLLQHIYDLYPKQHGLNNNELNTLAKKLHIDHKFVCLGLEHQRIIPLEQITYHAPVNVSWTERQALIRKAENQKLLDIMHKFTTQLTKPGDAAYIIANVGNHWILFALVVNKQNRAQIYIVNSNPVPLGTPERLYIYFFMPYIKQLNKKLA